MPPAPSSACVHVLGAGSIGRLAAHALASAGVPTTLLLRTPVALASLAAMGNRVTVQTPAGSSSEARVAAELAGAHQQGPIRHLLVTTKANDAVPALAALSHRLDARSVVVLLLNGVLGVYDEAVTGPFAAAARRPAFLLASTTHGERG